MDRATGAALLTLFQTCILLTQTPACQVEKESLGAPAPRQAAPSSKPLRSAGSFEGSWGWDDSPAAQQQGALRAAARPANADAAPLRQSACRCVRRTRLLTWARAAAVATTPSSS